MTGNDLRTNRKELGLTQAQMAHAVGVATVTLAVWETQYREDNLEQRLRQYNWRALVHYLDAA